MVSQSCSAAYCRNPLLPALPDVAYLEIVHDLANVASGAIPSPRSPLKNFPLLNSWKIKRHSRRFSTKRDDL
ncbi:hypothetical protein [Streptomyces sp. NBC_01794]|uniref:hypothetical protein n=1 Tax=Streptomyces sp. NBC_01794 TaxID=2975942 RepID=UPI003091A726|nr:hypothetical protein OIE54_00890 [Streptomyces sp. NBC_01794]